VSVEEPHLHLELGHILFLDIVGYSKLLTDEQKELVQELKPDSLNSMMILKRLCISCGLL
jgi:hypothetical protein